ncbi:NAD(P)H-binding protein [Actinophytocola glycyrrhizae]|uniref:NAD(P)H-binding protein n=1 Tax=Actinophytocola glycyrrhizae TaxID=2044873 RepID=A0ABV9S3N3_9PSEU
MTTVVLGGTGKTGRRLVRTLREAGHPVRAVSRSTEVRFDWSDQDTWADALAGATAVYVIAPADPALVPLFVEQAAPVRRFVVLSARGAENVAAESFRAMTAMEEAVRESGAEWTILRPNNFSQNFDEDLWHAPLLAGTLTLPIGDVPEPFVDARDIADVAAAALTTDGHHGQVYDLSGRRGMTFAEAVATIAAATGRPLRYEEVTPSAYRAELLAGGVPEEFADELDAIFAAMRAGHISAPGDGVRRALGRDPIDFTDYVTSTAATGVWSTD